MRPPSVYANPACPAADLCDLLRRLHGPYRVGCRLVMILLSQQGWTATQIADLLGYDPCTVRCWIHCEDDGRGARSAGLTRGSTGLVPCIGSVGRAGRVSSAPPVRRSDLIRAWPRGLIAVLSVVWLVRATDPASKEEDGGPAHPARPRGARHPRGGHPRRYPCRG